METKEKKAFEPSGLVPRSIVRTFERFRQQLLPGSETAAIREYRISRYQVLVSARCLFTLLTIPIMTNWLVSSWLLAPLIEHFWNTQQNEIFLNSYQEERAFAELEFFSEKLFFESLLDKDPFSHNLSSTGSMDLRLVTPTAYNLCYHSKNGTNCMPEALQPSFKRKEFIIAPNSSKSLPLFITRQQTLAKHDISTLTKTKEPGEVSGIGLQAREATSLLVCKSEDFDTLQALYSSFETDTLPISYQPLLGHSVVPSFYPHCSLLPSIEKIGIVNTVCNNDKQAASIDPGLLRDKGNQFNLEAIQLDRLGNQRSIWTSLPAETPPMPFTDTSVKIREKVQEKILELAISYNQQTILSITNIMGDLVSIFTLGCLFVWMRPEIAILKSFLIEAIYSLSDTTKSFLLILLTDLLVGFHSPRGWETALELLLKHFGLPENQDFVFLFVATFPVLLDTVFKYWIFRHLNKISPSTVATYHSMIE